MTDRYENIRKALAMGPTPGPWTAKSHAAPRADNGDIGIINGKGMLVAVAYSNRCTRDNASLIAACDPDTIRELLAERDQLAAALEAAREDAERQIIERCAALCDELDNDENTDDYRHAARWCAERIRMIGGDVDATLDAAIDQALGKGAADAALAHGGEE